MPFIISILLFFLFNTNTILPDFKGDKFEIKRLSDHTYLHISYLQTSSFGNVACNGALFIHKNQAIVFDTPATEAASQDLIAFLEKHHVLVKYVVINHFHEDCLGGLKAFHDKGVISYANFRTEALAKKEGFELPKKYFQDKLILKMGDSKVENRYFGPAHAPDNIVSYFSKDKVMFGGCMVKDLGAGKGNLSHADENEWPKTINKIKKEFPDVKIIIPGHGKVGNIELLDYTIKLFSNPK